VQHDVLRFDVAVDDTVRVEFVDRLTDLLHYQGHSRLGHGL
jgi:hypothetical protein